MEDRARTRPVLLLACFVMAFLVLAVFLAWVLVNHGYEDQYLGLGSLVVRGQLSLYQNEMTGQWVPLPFYVYGLSQVIAGPNLLAARLLSVGMGVFVLILIFALSTRWGGLAAGAVASGLFCTHGLVVGYFATAHFASIGALLHLFGIYVLFCTDWPKRDLLGMAVFSLLFLVKPHYWPTIPFVLLFLLWRARNLRSRVALIAVTLAVPALFFASDREHIKILAYAPILRDWVAPLGYHSWHSLIEDPVSVWRSDYADIGWETSPDGRLVQVAKSFAFFLKRYAVWMAALGGLAVLRVWQRAGRRDGDGLWGPPGVRFTFWLFWYLVAWQFVIVGPYIKQSFAYVGTISPLIAVVIGWMFAVVREGQALPRALRATVAVAMVAAVMVSPWVHRHHNLPRKVSLSDAAVPALRSAALRLASLIPSAEKNVFWLGDPLPAYLAGRRPYLRQSHDHLMVFTSVRERSRYERSGMWGLAEVKEWLGSEADYAVIQPAALRFYRGREPYREVLGRLDELIARNFILAGTVKGIGSDTFLVYRRIRAAAGAEPPGQHPPNG